MPTGLLFDTSSYQGVIRRGRSCRGTRCPAREELDEERGVARWSCEFGVCDPVQHTTEVAPSAGPGSFVPRGLVTGPHKEVLQYVVDGVLTDPDASSIRSTPRGEQCRNSKSCRGIRVSETDPVPPMGTRPWRSRPAVRTQ